MLVITIPKPLREKLGDKASDSLVELLNKVYQTTREDIVEVSLDKFEKKLVSETSQLDKKITGEILRLEQRLIEEVTRLEQKIAETEAKLDKRITEEYTMDVYFLDWTNRSFNWDFACFFQMKTKFRR